MTPARIIEFALQQGVRLYLEDGALRYRSQGPLSEPLRALVTGHRDEVISHLMGLMKEEQQGAGQDETPRAVLDLVRQFRAERGAVGRDRWGNPRIWGPTMAIQNHLRDLGAVRHHLARMKDLDSGIPVHLPRWWDYVELALDRPAGGKKSPGDASTAP